MTMSTTPLVSILTYCAHPALAYGTLLVFKTLRTGFPTARIEVLDNGSHPDVSREVARAAADVGATFQAMTPRHYAAHLRWVLTEREHGTGPLVLVDPDVIFWSSVEAWEFGDSLMAGRYMPQVGQGPAVVASRLHPSCLWVPDVRQLRSELQRRAPNDIEWGDTGARATLAEGRRVFWDTLATLYHAFPERCARFTEQHLDCFDHLFFGSHLPVFGAGIGASLDPIREGHRAAAAGDLESLRGLWRRQDAFHAGEHTEPSQVTSLVDLYGRRLASIRELQQAQGVTYTDDELRAALGTVERRMAGGL